MLSANTNNLGAWLIDWANLDVVNVTKQLHNPNKFQKKLRGF
jgi:hypothetical protein